MISNNLTASVIGGKLFMSFQLTNGKATKPQYTIKAAPVDENEVTEKIIDSMVDAKRPVRRYLYKKMLEMSSWKIASKEGAPQQKVEKNIAEYESKPHLQEKAEEEFNAAKKKLIEGFGKEEQKPAEEEIGGGKEEGGENLSGKIEEVRDNEKATGLENGIMDTASSTGTGTPQEKAEEGKPIESKSKIKIFFASDAQDN